jgi:SAM-dependent methyltransferase
MHVSPAVYRFIVHPAFYTRWFAERYLKPSFELVGRKVLEFGCGIGVNCIVFDPGLYRGVDIDAERIAYARTLHPEYRFDVVGTGLSEIDDGAYDVVLIGAVLHHLTDRQIEVYQAEFLRILKPDGVLIVFEPYLAPNAGIINWFMKFLDEGKYLRTEDGYLALLKDNFEPRVLRRFRVPYLSSIVLFIARRLR